MCLIIKNGKWPDCVSVAEKDIVVWKIMQRSSEKGELISFCFDYPYRVGLLYQQEIRPSSDGMSINEGYHAYIDRNIANISYKKFGLLERVLGTIKLVKCIIPKGSEYILGRYGDIVSNQIIINT